MPSLGVSGENVKNLHDVSFQKSKNNSLYTCFYGYSTKSVSKQFIIIYGVKNQYVIQQRKMIH